MEHWISGISRLRVRNEGHEYSGYKTILLTESTGSQAHVVNYHKRVGVALQVACVASVSVRFRSKQQRRVKNRAKKWRN